jgi:hypothetical protein
MITVSAFERELLEQLSSGSFVLTAVALRDVDRALRVVVVLRAVAERVNHRRVIALRHVLRVDGLSDVLLQGTASQSCVVLYTRIVW